MGASKLLVRLMVRMRPCSLSLFPEEMAIWVLGAGDPERARLMSAPPGGGDAPRFDMLRDERECGDDERGYEESEQTSKRDSRADARAGTRRRRAATAGYEDMSSAQSDAEGRLLDKI